MLTNKLIIPMRKSFIITGCLLLVAVLGRAQEDVYPTPAFKGVFYITNATIHVGNGQVINGGAIKVNNGKIEAIGANVSPQGDAKVYDAKGKQVYPGLILSVTDLGLKE